MPDHAPFRADQVGSLLRPPALKAAREQQAKGEISKHALSEIEDRFIRDAVKKQEAVGLQAITDGDFRRTSWSGDFLTAIENVVQRPSPGSAPQESTPVGGVVRDWQPPTPQVIGKLGDTNLAYLCDQRLRERVRSLGEDPDQLPHLYARLINGAIKDRPADMK